MMVAYAQDGQVAEEGGGQSRGVGGDEFSSHTFHPSMLIGGPAHDEYRRTAQAGEVGPSRRRRGRIRHAGTLGFPSTFQGAEAVSPWAVLRPKRSLNS